MPTLQKLTEYDPDAEVHDDARQALVKIQGAGERGERGYSSFLNDEYPLFGFLQSTPASALDMPAP